MKNKLLDIIEHTFLACDVDYVRTCADDLVHVRALSQDKSVVVRGVLSDNFSSGFGIANGLELYALLTNSKLIISEHKTNLITFSNAETNKSYEYSFISEKRISDIVPVVTLKDEVDFDVLATIPSNFVDMLKAQSKICADESFFEIKSSIEFMLGDWTTKVQGNVFMPAEYRLFGRKWWPINTVIKILSQSGDFKLGVSASGILGIQCNTNIATYTYLLPAHTK